MKKVDIAFLLSVLGVAGALAMMSLTQAIDICSSRSFADVAVAGVAGKARDVNIDKLRALIRQGHLSNHEAEFYREFTESLGPVQKPPSTEPDKSDDNMSN